jgi:hypothetical protein
VSYTIEIAKRIVRVRLPDPRIGYTGSAVYLFLSASACNNVTPRRYEWSAIAHEVRADGLGEWNGEFQLPARIWSRAHAADGGEIKPGGRDVSGVAYVKQWKNESKRIIDYIDGAGRVSWWPNLTIGIYGGTWKGGQTSADVVNSGGAAALCERADAYFVERAELYHAALKRLFPNPLRGGQQGITADTIDRMADALFLYVNRESLPFHVWLGDSERSIFLNSEPNGAPLLV